jgi:hypothetical protein
LALSGTLIINLKTAKDRLGDTVNRQVGNSRRALAAQFCEIAA